MAYFPNGTAGMTLDEQCCECIHGLKDDEMCPVYFVQASFNYDQIGNEPMERLLNYLVGKEGVCQMKQTLERCKLINHEDNEISELERFDKERQK